MMQEYTTPGGVDIDADINVTSALWRHESERPDHPILAYRQGTGPFVDMTYSEMASQVRRIAAGLMALGLEKGDRVCLFSPTLYEFTLFDYAIWTAGCATVTIYETSSADQVDWIVSNSEARAIICATDDLKKVFLEQAGERGTCEHVISLEAGGMGSHHSGQQRHRRDSSRTGAIRRPRRPSRPSYTPRARPAVPRAAS